jgi:hypothetical protein
MPCYYEFMVERWDSRPITWCSFLFRDDLNFEDLHQAIQAAAEWRDRHAYRFWSVAGELIVRKDHPSLEAWRASCGDQTPIGSYFCPLDTAVKPPPDMYPPPPPDVCVYEYPLEIGFFTVTLQHRVLLDERFERRLLGGGGVFSPEMEDGDSNNDGAPSEKRVGKERTSSNAPGARGKPVSIPLWDAVSFNLESRRVAFDR